MVLSLGLLVWPDFFLQKASNEKIVFSQNVGIIIWGFILLGLVVGLSQLEQILRGIRDPSSVPDEICVDRIGGVGRYFHCASEPITFIAGLDPKIMLGSVGPQRVFPWR